jgi:hypothetical protein
LSSGGPNHTTIRGVPGAPAVVFQSDGADGPTLAGFTVTGGDGLNGGGLFLSGSVAVLDCTVTGNSAENGGGAFLAGTPMLSSVRFESNNADRGGGVYVSPGGQPFFDDCAFVGNGASLGGGAYVGPHAVTTTEVAFSTSRFDINTADEGGAIFAIMSDLDVDVSSFTNNSATGSGGALRLVSSGPSVVRGAEFRGNQADRSGGAACITDSSELLLTDCEVVENEADVLGGGLEADSASLLAVELSTLWGNLPEDIFGDWNDLGDNSFDRPPACAADVALPYGVLNFNDILAWLPLYDSGDPAADLAEPYGAHTFGDVHAFIMMYLSRCE